MKKIMKFIFASYRVKKSKELIKRRYAELNKRVRVECFFNKESHSYEPWIMVDGVKITTFDPKNSCEVEYLDELKHRYYLVHRHNLVEIL